MKVELWRMEYAPVRLREILTNQDGRCDQPLLEGTAVQAGIYQLVFHAGDYYRIRDASFPAPSFLDQVIIQFGITVPDQHYHVPLLLSPYGYTTYRGS